MRVRAFARVANASFADANASSRETRARWMRGRARDGCASTRRRSGAARALDEIASDVALGVACYWISDELAQRVSTATHATVVGEDYAGTDGVACELPSGNPRAFVRDDARRARYASFGAVDGGISYLWYEWVDKVVPDDPMRGDAATTLIKVLIDAAVYNPVWAAFFIAYMGFASGKAVEGVRQELERDWFELFKSNCTFWVPMNFIIYGLTPLDYRVWVLYALNILFVCSLSLFEERKTLLKDSGETMGVVDVVARVLPDETRTAWRELTGCPRCDDARLVPCPICVDAAAPARAAIVDLSGRTLAFACEGCQDSRRIPCPECTNKETAEALIASMDEATA